MITKKQLIDSLTHETSVVKHLRSKLPNTAMDYRPAANMRSTLELLRYLTICAVAPARCVASDNWDLYNAYVEDSQKVTPDSFAAAMDKQLADLKSVINQATDEQLRTKTCAYPWGGSDILGMALINTSLKFITAYRMQLFIYAKQSACPELNTMNNWGGIDQATPK